MARPLALASLVAAPAAAAVLALVGCGSADPGAELLTEADTSHTAPTDGKTSGASGSSAANESAGSTSADSDAGTDGDSCGDAGATSSCHAKVVDIDGFRWCAGVRTCDPTSGTWGPCVSTLVITDSDASSGSADGG